MLTGNWSVKTILAFVWMTSPDGKYRIVVGQEWEYREDMALAIVAGQLIPWLVALPIMLIIMMVLLGRELAPLNKLALALRMRDPDSEKPLNATGVPSEVRPLVESLNQLFARTHAMMVRERRFTSDAAHELRSPLTALKVQTEVAQLSDDDPQARKKRCFNYIPESIVLLVWLINCSRYRGWTHWITFRTSRRSRLKISCNRR